MTSNKQPNFEKYRKPPETLTFEESESFLRELRKEGSKGFGEWKNLRNYTMALLMLDAGLRVGEVVRLKISNLIVCGVPVGSIDLSNGLEEKHCERLVPCSERLLSALKNNNELTWSALGNDFEHYAFFDFDSRKHITVRQVQRIVRCSSKSAFGREIHPHVLRHTFATRLMRVAPAPVVQQLLGHKHISSTQVYTHPNGDDCKKAIENMTNSHS